MGTRSNRLVKAVLTNTHNICFGGKNKKKGIHLQTKVFLYKSGVQWGILFMDMFSYCIKTVSFIS